MALNCFTTHRVREPGCLLMEDFTLRNSTIINKADGCNLVQVMYSSNKFNKI